MTYMSESLRRKPGAALRGNLLNVLTFSKHLKREDLPIDKVFLGICRAANGETLPFPGKQRLCGPAQSGNRSNLMEFDADQV